MHDILVRIALLHHEHDSLMADYLMFANYNVHRAFVLAIEAEVLHNSSHTAYPCVLVYVPGVHAGATFWPRSTVDAYPSLHYSDHCR